VERATFEQRLLHAAARARDFACKFIAEPLPDALLFRVHLNSSYDLNAGADFRLYPEDSTDSRVLATKGLTAGQAVDELWRDGWVPQWINISVVGETGAATVIELVACGRFTADETDLYYLHTDVAPFGIKGPVLPFDFVEGQRFSIYTRSSCYTLAELARARRNAAKVWSLQLEGPAFDDGVLATQLAFSNLRILELHRAPLGGRGLVGLAGLPSLAHLRMELGASDRLDLGVLPRLEALESFSLKRMPGELAGVGRLATALPNLRELWLASDRNPRVDAELSMPALECIGLELPDVPRWIVMPRALRRLFLRATTATDDDVCRVLAACPDQLEHVDLSGSPVSDRVLAALDRFAGLRVLSAHDTRIAHEVLWRFAAQRSNLECRPRPPRGSGRRGRN
jgi:hypothetical protein